MDSNQPSDLGLQMPVTGQAGAGGQAQGGGVADEQGEIIDQEWVNKAKDIVERTKNDPFTQAKELSKVKAGYLKARYNKDFKTGEDGA